MKIINPLQMNNWPIKKFLIMIFTFQLLLWGSIGLDSVGFRIHILRQVICFIYLTFIPGILILRILRLHKLESIESLLYSVGLSLSVLMFIGFFMNKFYPLIGISRPISIIPLTVTISFILLFLCGLCYIIDRGYSDPRSLYMNDIFSTSSLFLCLIPIWTIIGTYLMNSYNDNSLLIIVIFLISLIIVLVSFNRIPSSLYPLAIFTTSFSLLFHNSLISMYIFGWDIQIEYYLANKVISNSLWNPTVFANVNAMLSIVILAPIYSILSNTSLIWVFKIIYPAIFSLMPLGLYFIFKQQTSDKIAFMSVYFFTSVFIFFTEMLQLARQQIAEYFFMLILLLIVQNRNDVSNHILLLLFSFSIITSHYGLSCLALCSIICGLFLLSAFPKYLGRSSRNNTINLTFTVLFTLLLISWYIYTSNSSILYSVITIFSNMTDNFISDFLNPDEVQGIYVVTKKATTLSHEFYKLMHLLTQLYISIGFFYIIKRSSKKYLNFSNEYLFLCVVFYLMLIAALTVPSFAGALNTARLYQITLILLAPFCVIGGFLMIKILSTIITIIQKNYNNININKLQNNNSTSIEVISNKKHEKLNVKFQEIHNFMRCDFDINICKDIPLKILSIFFAIFLLFNTGWIYEMMGDSPTSYSLNNTMDCPKFNEQEVIGSHWFYQVYPFEKFKTSHIYADYFRFLLLRASFGYIPTVLPTEPDNVADNSYIYYSTFNIVNNEVVLPVKSGENIIRNYFSSDEFIVMKDKIYDNGGARIYNS